MCLHFDIIWNGLEKDTQIESCYSISYIFKPFALFSLAWCSQHHGNPLNLSGLFVLWPQIAVPDQGVPTLNLTSISIRYDK